MVPSIPKSTKATPYPSSIPSTSASASSSRSSSSIMSEHSRAPTSLSSASPHSFSPIHPEPDKRGNLEYKLRILPVSAQRFSRLVTQLKWRLAEGGGLAVYEIGVLDDGSLVGLSREEMRSSLAQLAMMGRALGANCEVRRCIVVEREASADSADTELSKLSASLHSLHPPGAQDPNDASDLLNASATPFRHRLGTSSKNQSAGLDNIVGLKPLNNKDAAELLGHGDEERCDSLGWRFEIADSETSSSGQDDGDISGPSESPPQKPQQTDSDEGDDDGFAFSLSLSDDENPVPQPAIPRRMSRNVNNSPWQARTPEYSPASRASPLARPFLSSRTSSSDQGRQGTDLHTAPPVAAAVSSVCLSHAPMGPGNNCTAIQSQGESQNFSDLASLDVEGVLCFALDPNQQEALSHSKRSKRKNGRQRRADSDKHDDENSPGVLAPSEDDLGLLGASIDEDASASVLLSSSLSNSLSSVRQPMTLPKNRISRGPRLERRARRLAELKAREREGEGSLVAMAADPTLIQERQRWWKFSGLSLDHDLPNYDATRQAWVREVADWLTVEEVKELSHSWDPSRDKREALDSMRYDGADETPSTAFAPQSSSLQSDGCLSRKAEARRRRREMKKVATEPWTQVDEPWTGSSYPPDFVPPPSSAVKIPITTSAATMAMESSDRSRARSIEAWQKGGSGHSHSLTSSSVNQEYEDNVDDVDDDDDQFSMGVTLNIDEHFPPKPARRQSSSVASTTTMMTTTTATPHSISSIASSPSGASTVTVAETLTRIPSLKPDDAPPISAVAANNSGSNPTHNDDDDDDASSQPVRDVSKVRIIVEAVLSLGPSID